MERLTEKEIIELWEERAAIIEFDGDRSRSDAERRAYVQVKRMLGPDQKMPVITFRWHQDSKHPPQV